MGQHEEILKQDLVPYNEGISSGARLVPIDSNEQEPLTSLCLRMREKLETHHVICPEVRSIELCQALRDQDPTVRVVLEDGFYKLLVIEVSKGLDSKGGFDHDGHFLPYLRQALYTSFGVEPTDDFRPEQIAQAAKDEPRSLFCFLDAQYIQGPEIQRLRIFTQTHHRVLLCAIPPATGPPVRSSPIQDEDDKAELSITPGGRPFRNYFKNGPSRVFSQGFRDLARFLKSFLCGVEFVYRRFTEDLTFGMDTDDALEANADLVFETEDLTFEMDTDDALEANADLVFEMESEEYRDYPRTG
jgi:hypothetical protein